MDIICSPQDTKRSFGPSVVTLGNFDGVHLGHRELFRRVRSLAKEYQCQSIVYTLNPHPLKFLFPEKAPLLLNTLDEKRRLIAASKIDVLIEAPFTHELASLSPERFVDEVLIDQLQIRALVVGFDYAFGKGRCGDAAFLQDYAGSRGVRVEVLQPVGADGLVYSSTRVRQLVALGEVSALVSQLGRQYNFEGQVVPGEQRGRQLGFPTANLITEKEQLPASGVYAVKVKHHQQVYDGVLNIGNRPTFADAVPTIEVHLLGCSGSLYEESLRVYFIERLRSEKRFESVDDLIAAIADDVLKARQILQGVQIVQYQDYLSSC